MKKLSYITLFLLTVLLAGCTTDEKILDSQSPLLSVTVTAGGFSPDEETAETRTTDVEYTTTFTKDDRIGIFAVADDGVILDNNVPYMYDGTNWTPVDADNTIHNYNYAGVTYFAYYPYSTTMNGAASEQAIIGKFTPLQDQSTQANYTASDLMTGAGTVSDADTDAPKMKLALQHRMSLIVVDVKSNSYVTSGGYQYTEPITDLSLQVTAGSTDVSAHLYHPLTSMYRYIIPAGTAISVNVGYNAGKDNTAYSYSTSIGQTVEGKYCLINMQRGETIVRNLKVGDFYYQDGSILPGEAAFYSFAFNPCIGVIYKLGIGGDDNLSHYNGKLTAIHGYVVSLQQASKNWGDSSKTWGKGGGGASHWGYLSTQMILEGVAEGKSFPAASYCVSYTPAPTGVSSGWYYPNCGQMRTFVVSPGTINAQLGKISGATTISGTYSSSSEPSASQTWGTSAGSGTYLYCSKGGWYNVRPVLTF